MASASISLLLAAPSTENSLKKNDVKLGTLLGVFVPCLQNILGIIFYIQFSWRIKIPDAS